MSVNRAPDSARKKNHVYINMTHVWTKNVYKNMNLAKKLPSPIWRRCFSSPSPNGFHLRHWRNAKAYVHTWLYIYSRRVTVVMIRRKFSHSGFPVILDFRFSGHYFQTNNTVLISIVLRRYLQSNQLKFTQFICMTTHMLILEFYKCFPKKKPQQKDQSMPWIHSAKKTLPNKTDKSRLYQRHRWGWLCIGRAGSRSFLWSASKS